ncbi:uncharacterized protein LOC116195535 [Punica granatum]|uniref:Uncharacterized protein LOC116195535 n=1 Tax=Punica granatum TaxID=22663 RepID=A0A6P8CGP9_PUNGR|nr:uncharacterized protein LOC116195535 [Punica granatum]
MHTLKGGWVGQTFALAKCNESSSDSGGKKSRIRRSKEERKAMVQSFINKYQNKNNGNFPSLNLTHKEVGGSFYTVREIVREIIQENRVLGPAKFSPQQKTSDDQFSQEYPLGSIAAELQVPLSMIPNEAQPDLVSFLNDGDSDEWVGLSDEKFSADKELQITNGSLVDSENDKPVVTAEAGVLVDESVISNSKVIDLTNVEVETFPSKSITEGANITRETTGKITANSRETLDERQDIDLHSRSASDSSRLCGVSSPEKSVLEDDKVDLNHARSLVAVESNKNEDSKVVGKLAGPSVESSDSSSITQEGITHDAENGKSLIDKESPCDASTPKGSKDIKEDAAEQSINQPNGVPVKSLNGAIQKKEAVNPSQETEIKTKPDASSNGSLPREKSPTPTLDRINLESWEVSSRSTSRKETNPLLAIFKAFVASFVKFWSE